MISSIVCMHGLSSEYLIKSTEMILGPQDNILYVNFLKDDNIDKLINNYLIVLDKLNTNLGVICMIDLWGGIPFNAACQIFKSNKYNYSIISGVNIPILIDFCMIRNKKTNIKELTESLISSGKIGINYLINNYN